MVHLITNITVAVADLHMMQSQAHRGTITVAVQEDQALLGMKFQNDLHRIKTIPAHAPLHYPVERDTERDFQVGKGRFHHVVQEIYETVLV